MNKKYFFFDIDGTLTDIRTGELVKSALYTIDKLKETGHFVAICTGRAHYKTEAVAKECHIENYVCNGGAGIVYKHQLVQNKPLNKEKALSLLKEAKQANKGVLVAFNNSKDVLMNDELFINQVGLRQEPTRYFYKQDYDYSNLKEIYKIYLVSESDEDLIYPSLKDLAYIRFGKGYITIQHDCKDQGIKEMIEYIGGNLEDVVVFGDGENDRIMFKPPFFSIGMGNGDKQLLKQANYITKPSYEDGIYEACKHFKWIND